MNVIREKQAYYPQFPLSGEPGVVPCTLRVVEAMGRHYLKTPFAMLNADADCDLASQCLPGRGYYETAADCQAYLDNQYPWWKQAAPIMDALHTSRYHYGELVGTGRVADKAGVDDDTLYKLARGDKRCSLKAVRAAVKALAK